MTNDDKQAAFPCCGNPETDHMVRGMDLRDWFAGMALQGLIASCANPNSLTAPTDESDFIHFTKSAYSYADAMMEAREK